MPPVHSAVTHSSCCNRANIAAYQPGIVSECYLLSGCDASGRLAAGGAFEGDFERSCNGTKTPYAIVLRRRVFVAALKIANNYKFRSEIHTITSTFT
eukprot:3225581-Rhodomonas_salina.1